MKPLVSTDKRDYQLIGLAQFRHLVSSINKHGGLGTKLYDFFFAPHHSYVERCISLQADREIIPQYVRTLLVLILYSGFFFGSISYIMAAE